MATTYCTAEMKFADVSALTDSTLTASSGQSFNNLEYFKKNEASDVTDYGLLGHNQIILDGSQSELADKPTDVAFVSSAKSGSDCAFATNPAITIAFTNNHSSAGLTFYFGHVHPREMRITWFNLKGNKLVANTFEPDALIYFASQQVSNYAKVVIEFLETCWPEQYIELQYIMYGKYIYWTGDVIQKASITEEIDTTGSEVSINNGSISILDVDDDFNIGNNAGSWRFIQKTQEIALKEYVDDTAVELGSFYIDDFSFKENVAKFSLIDGIGILDKCVFYDGDIYINVKAGDIIQSIFNTAGVIEYTLEDGLGDITLTGYIGVVTCREALQMVAFVIGAIVDDSRSNIIKIYKPSRKIKNSVGVDRKFNGKTQVTQEDYFSGVSVECSKYTLSSNASDIYDDVLEAGDNQITFSGPFLASSITASAGTIKERHTNYCIVNMTAEGECKLTGQAYEESKFIVSKNQTQIEAGQIANTKTYTGITLYNTNAMQEKLKDLLKYWELQKTLDMQYLINTEQSGEWVSVKDNNGFSNSTLIESQTIDLTGGFIATASCRGYTLINTNSLYAGNGELYADGDKGGAIS